MSDEELPVDISVIIPAYNMAEYLENAITSVLKQDFEAFEVLVVDDGSTDETEAVVASFTTPEHEKYDERVRYATQPNGGKARAVNHGLSLATGAYVTVLDADDELPPDSLSTRFEHRVDQYNRAYDLVVGGFEVFDDEGSHGQRFPPETEDAETLRRRFYLGWKTPFHLNACLIPAELIRRTGDMNESLQRSQDIDYAIRLLGVAGRVGTLSSVVYRYRKHRGAAIERIQVRLQTIRYRAQAHWNALYGWRKWAAVPLGMAMDVGKLVYEIVLGGYRS